jgi:HD-GYP domain-containing protein (c-di-GMP phosphodiesterase class II)
MTTDRSYRKARPTDEALAELRRCAGTDFDPAVVEALAESLEC